MRRLATLVLGIIAALLFSVAPASAHSVLVSSDPADGSSIDSGPAQARLTFNEAIQSQFASVTVVGPDGNLWSTGEPAVDGVTVSVPVGELGPTGTYTIAYRVTSADGHPVSGTRAFTLTTEGSGTPGPAADADASTDSDSGGVPLWPFLVAAVAVFVGALAFALRRKV